MLVRANKIKNEMKNEQKERKNYYWKLERVNIYSIWMAQTLYACVLKKKAQYIKAKTKLRKINSKN